MVQFGESLKDNILLSPAGSHLSLKLQNDWGHLSLMPQDGIGIRSIIVPGKSVGYRVF